jgi:transcriptional regulator of acetoin/glycerol metabolism
MSEHLSIFARQVSTRTGQGHSALDELLRRFQGRVTEAARHVGLSRPKLYRMLWAEGIDPASFRGA